MKEAFAEILGDNINCGYRYNISVNDGYREDPNGVAWDKKGKIFWISNFCGQNPIKVSKCWDLYL